MKCNTIKKNGSMIKITKISALFITIITFLISCKQDGHSLVLKNYKNLTTQEKRMPQNAVLGLKTHAELETHLFASEPMVVNPTNIDIDSKGRVWVTEGINYRIQIHTDHPVQEKGDKIVILEDVDGDGKADTSKVFYQGTDINSALGILVLGNKVIVSCSPKVLILTDTNGDDKADKKEVLFDGISGVQHDHGVHAFIFGPDGKFYFNFGNSGKSIFDKDMNPIKDKSGAIVNHSGNPFRHGMIFRCNLDGSGFEVLGHNFRNNYELAVDSYGTMWQSDNDDDGNRAVRINYVMEYGNFGYTDEMTGAGWRSKRTGMHDSIPIRHWHQNDPGSIPNLIQTGAGSPTGILVYEDDLLPKVFQGQIIHADAGPNIVRSYTVQNQGAGYSASIENILEGNQDQWFRPSDVCVAPDGSLLVADWYDPGVGGHGVGDLNRGRIFRIAPKANAYNIPKLEIKTTNDAIKGLKSPNMSTRYLAWTFIEELGSEAESSLLELWESSNAVFRARALWLLSNIDGRAEYYIKQAFKDQDPNIRITAIRAARNLTIDINPLLTTLLKDPSAQVRREIAIAIRNDDSEAAEDIWIELALQHDGNDRWYLEALGIGATNKSQKMYLKWLEKVGENWNDKSGRDIIWRLRNDEALEKLVDLISNSPEPWQEKLRYFRAFDFHSKEASNKALLNLIKMDHEQKDRVVITALSHFSSDFATSNPEVKKLLFAYLDTYKGTSEYLDLVRNFKLESELDEVFTIAIDSAKNQIGIASCKLLMDMKQQELILSKINDSNSEIIIELLGKIGDWNSVRLLHEILLLDEKDLKSNEDVLNALGSSRKGQRKILQIIEEGKLPTSLDSVAVNIFMTSGHEDLRKRASVLLQSKEISAGKTFPPISQLMRMDGDTEKGMKVFQKACISCHQVKGKGVDFGPNLSEIGNKLAKSALYKAILDPSEAISFGYEGVDLNLNDGIVVRGYISSDTENYIELNLMGGLSNRYPKSSIKSVIQIEGSLMTSMAVSMEEQELIDLVSYLEQLK